MSHSLCFVNVASNLQQETEKVTKETMSINIGMLETNSISSVHSLVSLISPDLRAEELQITMDIRTE